jgi:hypothetical protein
MNSFIREPTSPYLVVVFSLRIHILFKIFILLLVELIFTQEQKQAITDRKQVVAFRILILIGVLASIWITLIPNWIKINHACITYIWLLHLNISVSIFIVHSKCLRWLYKLLPILSHPQQHGLITNFIFTTHLWLKFFPLRGGKQPPLCTYDIILTYVPLVGFRMLCTYTHYFWQICNFYVPLKHQ